MLSGEPGIGKSSLARYAATAAKSRSVPVFPGFAWEAGNAPEYWPWTQSLGSLVRECCPSPAAVSCLAQILPDVSGDEDTPDLQPNQMRFRLLESVRNLLDDMSRDRPMVIVLEDLHAADGGSLQLLQFLARHVSSMPVLLIGTFRDVEVRSMPSGDMLLQACRDADVLKLKRLDESSVREYLRENVAEPVDDSEVRRLYQTTEGNPLFLAELVDLLASREPGESRLPDSIQQVIHQQIALLPDETSSICAKAAIIGREFDIDALASIAGRSADETVTDLATALETGFLQQRGPDRYRYSHVLHRDVLYSDLASDDRKDYHYRYADYLKRLVDAGKTERWSELAQHLNASGNDYRDEALNAWREAASRASARLAFDDAVALLARALEAFGDGPRYEPIDRFELLLECAQASMLTGDTETSHRHCRDAFEIAKALDDPMLMSEAALAWGSAIVVASVDENLIAALRESLDALPANEKAARARVKSRLAGAMQPAPDPSIPMDMAREAIAEARATGDPRVLFHVLGYAISALMDFAPADERLALNEEFGTLAAEFGDVPGQFRSVLRLVIDAAELADRYRMDQAIEDCRRLADRIGLPHYQWRAASVRAMQAMIEGDFAGAKRHLDKARALADDIDDLQAKATLPLQRFAILIDWASDDPAVFEDIDARLQDAYASGMAEAEFFVKPFINSHRLPLTQQTARLMLENRKIVERTFSGGDRYSLCRIGEIAAVAGDEALAMRAFERNLPFEKHCATLGLMGTICSGPIATALGLISASTGDDERALAFYDTALEVATSMRAPPWMARIHALAAATATRTGDVELAARHEAAAEEIFRRLDLRRQPVIPGQLPPSTQNAETAANTFDITRDGELWRIRYRNGTATLKDSRGLQMLARLIGEPEKEVHVLDLSGGEAVQDQGAAGPGLDAQARNAYESRLRELAEELEEAESFGDAGRADAAREEIEFITRELSRAFGLGGRARKSSDAAERARVNVRRRLKDAIRRISEQHADAGRYLENTIKTGTYCRYTPM